MDKRSLLFVLLLTCSLYIVNNYLFKSPTPQQTTEQVAASKETPTLKPILSANKEPKQGPINPFQAEKLYVLENSYQQLVFSSYGGSICEVNLPFISDKDVNSVIRPIGFDEEIAKRYPENNYFPLQSAYRVSKQGKVELTAPTVGGYMPLLRRSLKDESGKTVFSVPQSYYLANLITDEIDMEPVHFTMTELTSDHITFESKSPEGTTIKTYRFVENAPYTLELTVSINGSFPNLWLTSGVPEVELVSGSYSPLIQDFSFEQNKKGKLEKLKLPKQTEVIAGKRPFWLSNSNGFFGIILNPLESTTSGIRLDHIAGNSLPPRISLIDAEYDLYPSKNYPGYSASLPCGSSKKSTTYHIYAGPFEENALKTADATLALLSPNQENPKFSKVLTIQGWFTFISEPFAKFLFILMKFFHMITRSWGISIILLTLVLRLLLYPLSTWSFKSNLKMQKLAPKLKALQEKHKKDPKQLQMQTAMLYKTEGVNPFSGCLPILIQIPFLIGMFDLLKSTFALRGVGFIPGWINNLTAPDVLFSWNYPIIFFGTSFHLLPVILSGLMYMQQRMNFTQQEQKGPLTDQQKQMKSMGNVMSIVFLFFFYTMPSGLNIYWIFSTLFGMLQQWFFMNRLHTKT